MPSKKVLITAGPTIEPIDPVRFISNHSTGTLGYAMAKKCVLMGYEVCLVSGPVSIKCPAGVEFVPVNTALEMKNAVLSEIGKCDCIVMAAAVCDFRPAKVAPEKIKKTDKLVLELAKNPDILVDIRDFTEIKKIGFALETENAMDYAMGKLKAKGLDYIVLNVRAQHNDPFGEGKKDFFIIEKNGHVEEFKGLSKDQMAEKIVEKI